MLKHLLITLAILGFAGSAVAQDTASESNTSTTTLDESDKGLTEVLPSEKDLDQEITNARLRAESGSKSQWSMSVDLTYYGSSVETPFAERRPDYRRGLSDDPVQMFGSIKGRYRIDKNQSIALGTGITMDQPFHGGLESSENLQESSSVSNPYISWSSFYKTMGTQMSSTVSFTRYTAEGATAFGRENSLLLSQSVLGSYLEDRLTAGITVSGTFIDTDTSRGQLATYNDYTVSRGGSSLSYDAFTAANNDFQGGIYPFAEYTLTDMFAVRTVFGYFNFEHAKGSDDIEMSDPYQSLGIAISATRDIYLYPNVQFTPVELAGDRTNWGMSATINAF